MNASNTRLLFPLVLLSLVFTGCATNITRTEGPPAPPTSPLTGYNRLVLLETTLAPEYAEHEANQAAAAKIHENLVAKLEQSEPSLETAATAEAVDPAPAEGTLLIAPQVKEVKFIGGAARFWAGALAGSSAVYMQVVFTDAASGEVVANPEFYQHANAYAGAYSFGGADNAMLARIASLIHDYVVKYRSPESP